MVDCLETAWTSIVAMIVTLNCILHFSQWTDWLFYPLTLPLAAGLNEWNDYQPFTNTTKQMKSKTYEETFEILCNRSQSHVEHHLPRLHEASEFAIHSIAYWY